MNNQLSVQLLKGTKIVFSENPEKLFWFNAHLKKDWGKVEKILWSGKLKFQVLLENIDATSFGLRERDQAACYQRSVLKPAVMLCGCISTCWIVSLCIWKGTISAGRYKQALEQHTLPFRNRFEGRPCIFHQDSTKLYTASITTPWLH